MAALVAGSRKLLTRSRLRSIAGRAGKYGDADCQQRHEPDLCYPYHLLLIWRESCAPQQAKRRAVQARSKHSGHERWNQLEALAFDRRAAVRKEELSTGLQIPITKFCLKFAFFFQQLV